jgi:hypothetical protein
VQSERFATCRKGDLLEPAVHCALTTVH